MHVLNIDLPAGYTAAPMNESEIPELAALAAKIEDFDDEEERTTEEEWRHDAALPWIDYANDGLSVRDSEGQLVAWGLVVHRPAAERTNTIRLFGGVSPTVRRIGLGTAVLRWQVGIALQILEKLRSEGNKLPTRITIGVQEGHESRLKLAANADFTPIRYFSDLARDLSSIPPVPPVPEGLTLEPFSWELSDETRLAHNDAFRDHWGSEPYTAEAWQSTLSGPGLKPLMSRLIVDRTGAEPVVAGYALNAEYEQDWTKQGHSEGYTDLLGVRRAYRGRGLAGILLDATATACAEAGHPVAALGVDTENPSGALQIYTARGYKPRHRAIALSIEFPAIP